MRLGLLRWTGALVALLTVVGLTSACEPRTGAAAYVNGTRISESSVDDLVQPGAKPFAGRSGTVEPRSFALEQLVLGLVYDRILNAAGGSATTTEYATAKQTFVTANPGLTTTLAGFGFKSAFEAVVFDTQTKLGVLKARLSSLPSAQVNALIARAGIDVKLNPLYGTWDTSNLSITNGPAVGDFLRTSTAAS